MKKFFTLFATVAAMSLAAQAQDVIIPTNYENSANVVIVQNGAFDPNFSGIGSTGASTIISLGSVDFGETGDLFKAVGVRFSNGWGSGGYAVLKAGADYESAEVIARVGLIGTSGYGQFKTIAANMTEFPTGEQNLYLSFEERAGNLRAIYLYNEELTDADFASDGNTLLTPAEKDGYSEVATVLSITNAQVIVMTGSDTPRLDGDSWGWTSEGAVVDYGEMDFGNGAYKQVVAYAKHYSWNTNDYVEVYIDEVAEANRIATIFTGLEINSLHPQARNLETTVTGAHRVLLRWHGGSSNVGDVHFVKGNLWVEDPICVLPYENSTPSENAVRYSFRNQFNEEPVEGVVYVGEKSGRTEILNKGQWESNNVGYTGTGSVLKVTGVDFEDGRFNEVLMTYSDDKSWMGYPNTANFKLYIDVEGITDWANAGAALADVEPIAQVWMEGTGGWGNDITTKGDLANVTGVHDLYIYYNASDGANVKDIYLDGAAPAVKSAVNFDAEIENGTFEVLVDGEAIAAGDEVKEGTVVTVAVTPDDNYEVASVVVETAGDATVVSAPRRAQVDVEEADENTFTFEMPAQAVNIIVELQEKTVVAVTDIEVVNTANAQVKYVNAMGQVSDRPFSGINIVIEGTKVTKVVK